jgi:hypothetical protein
MKPHFAFALVLSLLAYAVCASPKTESSLNSKMMVSVLSEFLKQANNPKSNLGKSIEQANEGMKDGRNENGGISMPIKQSDVRVIQMSAEAVTNPWHYGETQGAYRVASAGENTFLVLLTTRTNVHMATETDSLTFTVATRELLKVKLPKDWKGGFDFWEDAPSPIAHSIQVDKFKPASLNENEKQ